MSHPYLVNRQQVYVIASGTIGEESVYANKMDGEEVLLPSGGKYLCVGLCEDTHRVVVVDDNEVIYSAQSIDFEDCWVSEERIRREASA